MNLYPDLESQLSEWKLLQPLKAEDEARLWQKFRLEWNFNSNHIEGNTLTYGETELFFLHDQIQSGHTHREYVEMKAHDAAIEFVRELALDPRALSEVDIRNLNKIALKEPFWKEATTPDGAITRKQIIPGDYKTSPNNVRTLTGETVPFASPEETPILMQGFVADLNQAIEKSDRNLIEIAAHFHHAFTRIHPFDDGNGRVARLIVNYLLLRNGCPPLIIRFERKAAYFSALREADSGNLMPLIEFFAEQLRWSLDAAIKAAKGESIEEVSDAEKEVALFVRQQMAEVRGVLQLDAKIVRELYELGWRALFESFERKFSALFPLFATHQWRFIPAREDKTDWRSAFEADVEQLANGRQLKLTIEFGGYRGSAKNPFKFESSIAVKTGEFKYEITASMTGWSGKLSENLYSVPLVPSEGELITSELLKRALERIKVISAS